MQEQFTACRTNYTNQFYARVSEENGVCSLVDHIIHTCSATWKQCHNLHDINSMKDMHTEAIVKRFREYKGIESCPTVVAFRKTLKLKEASGGPGGPGERIEVETCTDEDSSRAMTSFHTCSHAISTRVYNLIVGQAASAAGAGRDERLGPICLGLRNISTECPVHLRNCFAPDDVRQMEERQLDQMTTFFEQLLVKDNLLPDGKESGGMCDNKIERVAVSTTNVIETTTAALSTGDDKLVRTSALDELEVKNDYYSETNDISTFEHELYNEYDIDLAPEKENIDELVSRKSATINIDEAKDASTDNDIAVENQNNDYDSAENNQKDSNEKFSLYDYADEAKLDDYEEYEVEAEADEDQFDKIERTLSMDKVGNSAVMSSSDKKENDAMARIEEESNSAVANCPTALWLSVIIHMCRQTFGQLM